MLVTGAPLASASAARTLAVLCSAAPRAAPELPQSLSLLTRRNAACGAALGALSLALPGRALADPAVSVSRFSLEPMITPLPPLGALSRYEDQVSTPKGSKALSVSVRFEFPTQWTQLDKRSSITLVDGSTGLKTYVLKAPLPEGTTLTTVPKAWFGEAIFDPQGAIVKGGSVIEEFKVSKSKVSDAPEGAVSPSRRRLDLKYSVVTPANQRVVGRRAVADAYELGGVVYMLVASATETKWEGSEKERCERTADSFIVSGGL
jgi:hypothetical protein